MAEGHLPAPGKPSGPCLGVCAHRDCAETRRMAASTCRFCKKSIGYDKGFYADPEHRNEDPIPLVHAVCLYNEVEQRR